MLLLLAACAAPDADPPRPARDTDGFEHVGADTGPAWEACADAPPVRLNELVAANHSGVTDADGDTSDWLELALPADAAAVDLAGWALSTDGVPAWTFPERTLDAGAPLLVFASGKDRAGDELHASFALDALGEPLFLHMPDGCVADRVDGVRLYADVALGRDATGAWAYFLAPTPGAPNDTESRPGFAEPPTLTPGGARDAPAVVEMTGENVVYTLDGSVPEAGDTAYAGPVTLDTAAQPVVVRARAFQDGLWPSRVATATYWTDPEVLAGGVPVLSLVVDPPDLWDEDTGIYVPGPNAEPSYPYFGANFWQVWEKDLHVEIYAPDGTLQIAQDAGIQIAGGYSRAFDQRNFELLARGGYGPETFDAALFEEEDISAFHRLYLRNGGDWCGTQLIDGTVQALFRDAEGRRLGAVDAQAYRPVLVYLNGEFWGVYELKERLDENWIADHRGEDPDALDRVKLGWTHDANWEVEQGDWEAFEALETLVATRDLADPDAYAAFDALVDVPNFISATVAHGWIANSDWWQNNIRMWRPRRDGGEWRWMVYDFGHGWPSASTDHLATSVSGSWPGLPIGAALANEEFRRQFVNVHADYLNTTLRGDRAAATLRRLAADVRPVMAMQRARWCGGADLPGWDAAVLAAARFAADRAAYVDAGLVAHLGLSGHATLTLGADPPEAGRFRLTVVEVEDGFAGTYYQGVPVTVTAVPNPGWVFAGWSDGTTTDVVTLPMAADTAITATFAPG